VIAIAVLRTRSASAGPRQFSSPDASLRSQRGGVLVNEVGVWHGLAQSRIIALGKVEQHPIKIDRPPLALIGAHIAFAVITAPARR
jgi:hypothetical protein